MYLMLNETKVTVMSEVHDDSYLSLTVMSDELNMQELFDLFDSADKTKITLYRDDGQMYAVLNYYTAIESLLYTVKAECYTLTLSKVKMDEYQSTIKDLTDKLSQLETQMLEMSIN